MNIALITLLYLGILALIDINYNGKDFGILPTALTTFFIIFAFLLGGSLVGLIVFTLFGLMLYELKFYEGGQDIKIMAGLGCFVVVVNQLLVLIALIMFFGLIYKFGVKVITKGKIKKVAFVPVFVISYLTHLLIWGILL